MTKNQIIRAWKDEEFRAALSAAELSALPANPAGVVELSESEMKQVAGMTWDISYLPTVDFVCYPTMNPLHCDVG